MKRSRSWSPQPNHLVLCRVVLDGVGTRPGANMGRGVPGARAARAGSLVDGKGNTNAYAQHDEGEEKRTEPDRCQRARWDDKAAKQKWPQLDGGGSTCASVL